MESLNDFTKLHLKALNENTYHTLIRDDINYEDFFRNATSLKQVYDIFFNGIKFEDGFDLRLQLDDIVGFYLVDGNKNFSQDDINFLCEKYGSNDLSTVSKFATMAKDKVATMKKFSLKIGSQIQIYLTKLETYSPIEYEITENNEEKTFKLYLADGDNILREVNEGDALEIFNKLKPNVKFPVVLYSNSVCKLVGNFSNICPVDFGYDHINKIKLPPNSIAIMNKSGEYIIFDFELKKCVITVNPFKVNDGKIERVTNFIPMLKLLEEKTSKRISGTISFRVDKVIGYYSLYEYFITDKIASTLFYIDETTRAWCSKDTFYVFFRDFSSEMINSSDIRSSENYFRISIPTQKKESITGFTITFSAKSKEMLPSFLYKFSRILSHFISLGMDVENPNVSIQGGKAKIYTKVIKALSDKAGEFFRRESKERGEIATVTPGDYYVRVCQALIQPIIIEPDEVDEWIKYGREPIQYPPPEWGFKESMWFVCPKESYPVVNFKPNKQDETGRIKFLPCCSGGDKIRNISDVVIKNVNRRGMTELINSLGVIGALNDALATFLSIPYHKEGSYTFWKQGTTLDNYEITILNSAIIAVLIATNISLNPSKPLSLASIDDIMENIILTRNLMAQLPPDIYKQELYDMTDEEIIESILDPKTFIDPYLYYRGLEIIFGVQIFVFTSNIGRKNPISDEEDNLPIASLELPRCKYMHIRHDNKKDIVCLYKNYGSVNKISQLPACELIISTKDEKNYNKKVNSRNVLFFESMFKLLDKVCHPFEWEKINGIPINETCYDNPYTTIDWSKYDFGNMGKIIGQEVDIYGKTTSLIFKEWTMIIPPTQPLFIVELDDKEIPITKQIKIKSNELEKSGKQKEISHIIYSGGVKKRPQLKPLDIVCNKFDFTAIDDDGIWLEFNGKKKGIKILCKSKPLKNNRNFDSAIELIKQKNKLSILMQIINWLWRSDWDGTKFPNFIKWWTEHAVIEDSVIFHTTPEPKINCNNMMFPVLETFKERLIEMSKIWPFFFYRNKIHVSSELYERIQNNFNIEDIYSRNLTPDDIYGEPGRFITGITPTDDDYTNNESIILTNPEHIADWINRNSSTVFKFQSLNNVMVIREKITYKLKKMINPYIYKETIGDNVGKIYLIQNSTIPSQPPELSALGIAQYFRTHRKNPKHDYKVTDDIDFIKDQKYVVYKIGHNDVPEVLFDNSGGEKDYLQILRYDDDESFGAMMPIL